MRVILFDCEGHVKEFRDSDVTLQTHDYNKVTLIDSLTQHTYSCRIQKLKGLDFKHALVLTTKEAFEQSSRKRKEG